MRYRYAVSIITAFILLALSCSIAAAWGPTGHTLVTQSALTLIPAELKPFYDANSRYIVAFATLPDDWKQTHGDEEGPNHFINLDSLDKPPFSNVMTDKATAEKRFGAEKLIKAGLLPWAISEHYSKLVNAFRKRDSQEIVVQSALLAHYVADAHVPFHATEYYDGKTPEQKGIHYRWEEGLLLFGVKPENIHPAAPEKITDILHSALTWCNESFGQVEQILRAEDKARARDWAHGYAYYKLLSQESGRTLNNQLTTAAQALAGVYVSAWTEAGKPKLEDKAAPLFWK